MGKILSEANTNQNLKQDDALLLMNAASLLRKKSIVIQEPFTGSFDENCLSHPVPEVLLHL